MELIAADEFLSWAGRLGIAPDERYAEPRCLTYVPYRRNDRFWEVPSRAAAVPPFLSHLLAGLERWSACYLWPRGGSWPALGDEDDGPLYNPVRGVMLGGAGIPSAFAGAIRYEDDETDRLITAVFAQVIFGWMVLDDVFVVPDHGRYVLYADHHGVVHVELRDEADVSPFVEHMARAKYTLPDSLPDGTFKPADWMP